MDRILAGDGFVRKNSDGKDMLKNQEEGKAGLKASAEKIFMHSVHSFLLEVYTLAYSCIRS